MTPHYTKALLAAVLLTTVLAACGDKSRTTPSKENLAPIENAAKSDAKRVTEAPDTKERERVLLDIRAKEYALRDKGYNHSADIYIGTIQAALDTATIDNE